MCKLNFAALLTLSFVWLMTAASSADDAVDRLTAKRLEAVHQAVLKLQSERRETPRGGTLREYRANLHVHSAFSHDSRGTIDDIVKAAKSVGTSVVMFTEHPADHYDFFKDGHQGLRDGVLLIPGAEMKGLLVYPRHSVRGLDSGTPQEFTELVRNREGLVFLSHLEERMDWEIRALTGVEIYNTHADAKDEKRLLTQLRNPLWLFNSAELFRKYPQESYSALHDYPADYLKRWDQLCEKFPQTGISANDAHQNIGLTVTLATGNKARVEDALGKTLLELDATALAGLLSIPLPEKVGSVMFEMRLDPYANCLRHVGTHLLMPELTAEGVWQALNEGRAFVAFDWLADATGFDIAAVTAEKRHEMGSQVRLATDLQLAGHAPLAAHWKLLRNGTLLTESDGSNFAAKIEQPGNYRVELWLDVAGEKRIWILSNPFYVSP